jgi:hypothetical protein
VFAARNFNTGRNLDQTLITESVTRRVFSPRGSFGTRFGGRIAPEISKP